MTNAAILYADEKYQTRGPRLMGAQAASEEFLKAWVRHSGVEKFVCYSASEQHFQGFRERVAALAGTERPCGWIPLDQATGLSEVGCLYHPDPFFFTSALWQRRAADLRAFSACGVTHTTCSDTMMDQIGSWAIQPVEPWDAIICTSSAVHQTLIHVLDRWEDYLRERLGATQFTRPQLPVIPLGVEVDRFPPPASAAAVRRIQRAALGIGADDIAFLFFGRLSFHAKAHPLPMFLALEQARRRTNKRIQLILAGWFANPTLESQFHAGAARYCPSVRVTVVDGRRADIRDQVWYAADVFTSLADNIQETFGLTPLEAMAAGLPVVVSDWNGYRGTVRHGEDGFLVPTAMPPPGLAEEFASRYAAKVDTYDRYIAQASQCTAVDIAKCTEYFVALVENSALRQKLGATGRKRVEQAFSWKTVIAQYQALWRELAHHRERAIVKPRGLKSSIMPLRDDPFSAFAHYPTRTLSDALSIRLAADDASARLAGRYNDPFVNYAGEPVALARQEECQAILEALAPAPQTIGQVADVFPPDRRRAIVRSIGWLLKIGLIELADQ
jgi:glycosyltransferase involved in cell wall biosynthesis